MNDSLDRRIDELLIDRATDSLTDQQQDELNRLLKKENLQDDFSYDEMVASMQESLYKNPTQQLPAHIRSSVIDKAELFLDPQREDSERTRQSVPVDQEVRATDPTSLPRNILFRREALAWMSMAAALTLAAFLWVRTDDGDSLVMVEKSSLINLTNDQALQGFIADSTPDDSMQVELTAGNHPSGEKCQATVYWNRKQKRGFLKVENLASNDRDVEQYQLWVIDKKRGIEDRPNAGVFDITKAGVNVFEFRSELEVFDAQGFAVTVENPGGVAKSDLSKIALANLGG